MWQLQLLTTTLLSRGGRASVMAHAAGVLAAIEAWGEIWA
jgi:hypothetical protein